MAKSKRKRLTLALAALAVYVIAYIPLSYFGAYRVDMSGRQRWPTGLALMDAEYWQPRGMYFRIYKDISGNTVPSGNLLGWLYSPLILVDRALVHYDHVVDFGAPEGTPLTQPAAPVQP